jgi:uncharacterized repeat protein (TIGR01451 family)/LPXTG-motif cell wall-anchored protein
MSKLTKVAAGLAVVPMLAFAAPAFADGGTGQIETGDIYRVKNVTSNSAFADNITAACGDTVEYRVRIHNGGPETLTNVKVAATLQTAAGTTHGSTVTVTADNNLHGASATANAGVTTSATTTASYVSGTTELLNYSTTPGNESVLKTLPDGILNGGVTIGSVGPTTPQTEEVQFQVKLNCEVKPPKQIQVCELATKQVITINETDFNSTTQTKDLTKCATVTPPVTPPTVLPNTGAGNVIGVVAGAIVAGTIAGRLFLSRKLAR